MHTAPYRRAMQRDRTIRAALVILAIAVTIAEAAFIAYVVAVAAAPFIGA